MEDQVTDNQAVENGSADAQAEAAGTVESIMGSMAAEAKPEVKADTSSEKTEGKVESGDKTGNLPAWTSQLPEEVRNNADIMKQLGKFNKIGELAKSYSELEKKLGKSLVQPGDNASDEDKEAFFKKIGKPESAEGYEIEDENAKPFKELAYKNNLTKAQAQSLYKELKAVADEGMKQSAAAIKAQTLATEKSLREEYGAKFPEKMEMLKRGVAQYGGNELAKVLQQSGLLGNEIIVRHFITLGEMNAEAGTFNKGQPSGDQYKPTSDGGTFTFKGL